MSSRSWDVDHSPRSIGKGEESLRIQPGREISFNGPVEVAIPRHVEPNDHIERSLLTRRAHS